MKKNLLSPTSFRSDANHPDSVPFTFLNAFKRAACLLTVLLLMFCQVLSAKDVDPATAMQVAKHFYRSTSAGQSFSDGNLQLSIAYGETNPSIPERAGFLYIFNVNANAGFVIVAADDAVQPVLGYSDTGSFDPADIPDNMAKWLEGYQHEILYAVENNLPASNEVRQKWESLLAGPQAVAENNGAGPFLTTTWNQSPYYNAQCPGGSVTGCAATAMAQIMKYWNYPSHGAGFHVYVEDNYAALFANFGATTYTWAAMPNSLQQDNSEVAQLMYHCGVSIDMNYSPQSSGASPSLIAPALINYFNYDPGLQLIEKNGYPGDWTQTMKDELDASRPVLYCGYGTGSGHAFVCDGYNDEDLFHFNWGWGGSSDGWFALNALNPGSLGTGGGTGGGYNTGQLAIIGIKPKPGDEVNVQMALPLIVTPDPVQLGGSYSVITGLQNLSPFPFSGQVGLGLYLESDGSLIRILHSEDVLIGPSDTYSKTFSGTVQVPAAKYLVAAIYKPEGSNSWTQVPNGSFGSYATFYVATQGALSLLNPMSASPNPAVQSEPLEVFGIVTSLTGPVTADFAVDLWTGAGDYMYELDYLPGVQIPQAGAQVALAFYHGNLNVPPGRYLVSIRENTGSGWVQMNPSGIIITPTMMTLDVVSPLIQPDPYEDNETDFGGYLLGLDFVNDVAYVSTPGSNIDSPDDNDFFYIILDPGYTYSVKARVHDSYNSGNAQPYTTDVRWSYRAGTQNEFSQSYDDVILSPGMNFTTPSVDYVDFHIVPYYFGTLGTYLFEAEVTRTAVSAVSDLLPEQAVSVYPNPADDATTVSVSDAGSQLKTINLYALDGKLISSKRVDNKSSERISTAGLANGLYLISVVTDKGSWNSKLNVSR